MAPAEPAVIYFGERRARFCLLGAEVEIFPLLRLVWYLAKGKKKKEENIDSHFVLNTYFSLRTLLLSMFMCPSSAVVQGLQIACAYSKIKAAPSGQMPSNASKKHL